MKFPRSLFGELSTEDFLREYWQKRPLLVRGAWPGFSSPVSPEQLRELSGRDDSDSRIVVMEGGEYPWELLTGPFEADDFQGLPDEAWTLLVQEVDRLDPNAARILDAFPFLSNWRLDDIMVSLAVDRGGVGAHIDEYDVFLLQGAGTRRWQVESCPKREEHLKPDLDVRILADFSPDEEWIVEPGDLLYLPPRVAHAGTAIGTCMTYSIGCRAPNTQELLEAVLERISEREEFADRYSEQSGVSREDAADHPGVVSPLIVRRFSASISELFRDEAQLAGWIGCHLSSPIRGWTAEAPAEPVNGERLLESLRSGARLRAVSAGQLLYDQPDANRIRLFAGGDMFEFGTGMLGFVQVLTARGGATMRVIEAHLDHPEPLDLLVTLLNRGILRITDA